MTDAIRELKVRAEILHKRIQARDAHYIQRLRALAEYRRSSDENLLTAAEAIQRRDCLNIIAAEIGFSNWTNAKTALSGEGEAVEFGTLLYPKHGAGLNRWFSRYEEAAAVREASGGYLLAYRRDLLVVERDYIESLGLEPDDPDWAAIGFDWVRPASVAARTRLYSKLVAGLPREEE